MRPAPAYVISVVTLAAIYFLTGKLGLQLAYVNQSATPVWPPAGIALTALLLRGSRLWPGVWLGAFLVNITTSGALLATLGIATGNTLESALGAWLVRRFAHGSRVLERALDMVRFIALAALLSTACGATVGVTSLCLAGLADWGRYAPIWLTWWLGDMVSIIIIAPLLLSWSATPLVRPTRSQFIEATLLAIVLFAVGQLTFAGLVPAPFDRQPHIFLCVPPLLWAAFRFGPRGAITASVVLSGIALQGTVAGRGPFLLDDPNESLLMLQVFMGTMTVTALVLGAVVRERERAVESLLKSEERERGRAAQLHAIMQAVPAAVWIAHDPECRVITGNAAADALLRLPAGVNSSKSSSPARVSHFRVFQDGRALAPEELPVQRAARGEEMRDFEEEVRFEDGTSRHLLGNATPLRDARGRRIGAVAAFVDISERKQAERRLAGSLAITRNLAESRSVGDAVERVVQTICETLGWELGAMWSPDTSAGVLRCFRTWCVPDARLDEFIKVTRERTFSPGVGLPGRVWTSRRPTWIHDVTQDPNFPRAPYADRAGLHSAFAFPVISGDQFLAVMEFFSHEIREVDDALLAMFSGIGTQIGQYLERLRAEEALRQSESRKTAVLESALDCIIMMDEHGRIVDFNPAAERTFGHSRQDVIGRTVADTIIPPHLREAHRQGLAGYQATGQAPVMGRRVEFTALRADGSEFPVELAVTATQTEGAPVFFTAYLRDITDRKRAEQALKDADRRKDEFLAILAHELRNPLAPIRTVLALLRKVGPDASEARELQGVIDRQITQMARLLDDLMDVSRITSGKIVLRKERISLGTVVASAVESSRPLIEANQHELHVELPAAPIYLDADLTRLSQVFANLLNNAAKYTERGGHVWVTAERAGSEAVVRVRDTGIGIRPGQLRQIFEMFAQADTDPGRAAGGLGIGLTLAQRLVEMHGGASRRAARARSAGASSSCTCRRQPDRSSKRARRSERRPRMGVGHGFASSWRTTTWTRLSYWAGSWRCSVTRCARPTTGSRRGGSCSISSPTWPCSTSVCRS
jgi:PAS domain S-box-containing protein